MRRVWAWVLAVLRLPFVVAEIARLLAEMAVDVRARAGPLPGLGRKPPMPLRAPCAACGADVDSYVLTLDGRTLCHACRPVRHRRGP